MIVNKIVKVPVVTSKTWVGTALLFIHNIGYIMLNVICNYKLLLWS
jgi:hypothetical protein